MKEYFRRGTKKLLFLCTDKIISLLNNKRIQTFTVNKREKMSFQIIKDSPNEKAYLFRHGIQ